MERNSQDCTSCSGINTCNKYCAIKAGENLVKFINGLDRIETSIGDVRGGTRLDREYHIVSGFIYARGNDRVDILTSIEKTQLSSDGKFSNFLGLTPLKLLKYYLEYMDIGKEASEKAIEDFKKFNSNKVLPLPFKPGTEVMVDYVGFDQKQHKNMAVAHMIKWKVDPDSHDVEALILADINKSDGNPNYIKVKMKDYGTEWTMPNLERNLTSDEVDYSVVKMNPLGFVMPLEISDGNIKLSVDCSYLYLSKGGKDVIVGHWEDQALVEDTDYTRQINRTKAYKKLKSIIKFVGRHRRFIMPYGLTKPNHVDVE